MKNVMLQVVKFHVIEMLKTSFCSNINDVSKQNFKKLTIEMLQ